MVYYRFILCLLLVQLTSLNVSRITVDANSVWNIFGIRRSTPSPCKTKINSINIHHQNNRPIHFANPKKNDSLTFKKVINGKLSGFDIGSTTIPFCIGKFVDLAPKERSNGDLTGLPVNKPIRKMTFYQCFNRPRVFHFSTDDNPNGEWYKRIPKTNKFVPINELKGKTIEKVDMCQIAKFAGEAGCTKIFCTKPLPMKQHTGNDVVKSKSSVTPYLKYTFTPGHHRALTYDGKQIVWTDKYKREFKTLFTDDADEANVYYWEDPRGSKPLLLELKKGNKSTHYRNMRDGGDVKWQFIERVANDVELEDFLDDGNCYLNKAVAADVTFSDRRQISRDFCTRCNMRGNFKEETATTVESNEIMYNYFFGIDTGYTVTKVLYDDATTKNRHRISIPDLTLPTTELISFRLYYCNHNPALIYMEEKGKKSKWYKREGDKWKYLENLDNKTPSNANNCDTRRLYVKMLQELGCSFKPGECTPPPPESHSVTIDISKSPDTKIYVPNASTVEVKVSEPTEIDDFQKIVHTTEKETFDLSSVHHATTTTNIPAERPLTGVEVYYWKFDEDYAGPLLVKLSKKSGGHLWFENSGIGIHKNAGWNLVAKSGDLSTEKNLIEKLKVVNCKINHAYTFDLSKEVNYDSFCLNIKVEVTNDIINDLGYTKYSHNTDVIPFTLLALNKPPDEYMGLPDLTGQPMRNVSGVYVFKPKKEGDPALLYLETADKVHSGWYGNVTEEEEEEEEEEEAGDENEDTRDL